MKKTENKNKKYINLSKNESELLNKLDENLLFSTSIIRRKTGWSNSKIKNTIVSLKNKKVIISVKKK